MTKVGFVSLGCPKNQLDTEVMLHKLTAAGYELKNDIPCIYVEAADADTDSVSSYWVSVDSGLLVSAELRRTGEVIYRMTSSAIQSPCPAGAAFKLPDGTVLHTH